MKRDVKQLPVDNTRPVKKWTQPELRVINIKALTQSGGLRLGDNAGGISKRS